MATSPEDTEITIPTIVIPIPNLIPCEPPNLDIQLPGGFSIKPFLGGDTPFSDCNQIESLMQQLQAALSAIQPVFLISDVLLAVLACIQAIPDAITSLSPAPLYECLEGLLAALIALVCALYPPFAYPVMILSIIRFITSAIRCVRDNLDALCDGIRRLTNLQELVKLGLQPELDDILSRTNENLRCQQVSLVTSLEVIITLLEFINGLIEVANSLSPTGDDLMPQIPIPVIDGVDTPCEEIVAIMDDILSVLDTFTAVIPDCDNPI